MRTCIVALVLAFSTALPAAAADHLGDGLPPTPHAGDPQEDAAATAADFAAAVGADVAGIVAAADDDEDPTAVYRAAVMAAVVFAHHAAAAAEATLDRAQEKAIEVSDTFLDFSTDATCSAQGAAGDPC